MKNINILLSKRPLSEWIKILNWQGGTIHQAKEAIEKRLIAAGMIIDDDGTITTLTCLTIAR